MKIYAPITKMEERDDGTLFVSGVASAESVDSQGEVITSDAMKAALPDFFKHGSGNLREMHQMIAAGRVDKAEIGEDGKTYIECIVVDPVAVKKVQTGTYKGFSVGGRALSKTDGVISALRLTEISLVDRPANPDAVISVWKADGADEQQPQDGGAPTEGAGASQPTTVAKSDEATGETVEKGMYNMQRLIEALQCIKNAMSDASYEQKYGEHSAEMIADMKAAYVALGAVAQKYLAEEITPPAKPVEISMADGAGDDVAKAGAMYSKSTKAALAKVHGMIRDCDKMMKGMGYDADAAKADDGTDVAKASMTVKLDVQVVPVGEDVAKSATDAGLSGITAETNMLDLTKAAFDALAKSKARVTELEAQPAPAKAATTTIEKSGDTKDGLASPAQVQGDPSDPLSMFKAVLARPLSMGGH